MVDSQYTPYEWTISCSTSSPLVLVLVSGRMTKPTVHVGFCLLRSFLFEALDA